MGANVLKSAVGALLNGASYYVHRSDGGARTPLFPILYFENGLTILFKSSSDATHIQVERGEPDSVNLVEYGILEIISAQSFDPWKLQEAVGGKLLAIAERAGHYGPDAVLLIFAKTVLAVSLEGDEIVVRPLFEDGEVTPRSWQLI